MNKNPPKVQDKLKNTKFLKWKDDDYFGIFSEWSLKKQNLILAEKGEY